MGAVGFELAGESFAGLAELVALVDVLDELLEADAMMRPTTMVAMWMKKSRHECGVCSGGWTSSIRGNSIETCQFEKAIQ